MDVKLANRLEELKKEDFIWIIYIAIIILSLYSNVVERDYLITKNEISKNKYRLFNIIIFSVLVLIYIYFTKSSYDSYQEAKLENDNDIKYHYLAFLAALLTLLGGIIFLYIVLNDENISVEIAF